jgi:hypothetical protein
MEPEGLSSHSHMPATCLHPEPAQSSPHPTLHFLNIILILYSHLLLDLHSGLFTSGFPPKPYTRLSSSPYALHAPPFSFICNFTERIVQLQYRICGLEHGFICNIFTAYIHTSNREFTVTNIT